MPEYQRRIDVMLDGAYIDRLGDRSLDELRSMHRECLEVETEVSYVRRLALARIDIIDAELERRARGGGANELIDRLPEILAGEPGRPGPANSRFPQQLAPSMDIPWRRGLERLITDATLINLPTLSETELRETLGQLRLLKNEVTERRRRLHRVIDAIDQELTARPAVGQA